MLSTYQTCYRREFCYVSVGEEIKSKLESSIFLSHIDSNKEALLMTNLQDYSGPFDPKRKYEDFSPEALTKLLKEYQRAYMIVIGELHRVMRERFGEVQAIACLL
jgi:hypothetical protein